VNSRREILSEAHASGPQELVRRVADTVDFVTCADPWRTALPRLEPTRVSGQPEVEKSRERAVLYGAPAIAPQRPLQLFRGGAGSGDLHRNACASRQIDRRSRFMNDESIFEEPHDILLSMTRDACCKNVADATTRPRAASRREAWQKFQLE